MKPYIYRQLEQKQRIFNYRQPRARCVIDTHLACWQADEHRVVVAACVIRNLISILDKPVLKGTMKMEKPRSFKDPGRLT